jgi:hypothetical protein
LQLFRGAFMTSGRGRIMLGHARQWRSAEHGGAR